MCDAKWHALCLCFVSGLVLLMTGCISVHSSDEIWEVVIIRYRPGPSIRSESGDEISKWEACFPGYKSLPRQDECSGFFATYDVIFRRTNGMAYYVFTDGKIWGNGLGVFPVNGNIDETYRGSIRTDKQRFLKAYKAGECSKADYIKIMKDLYENQIQHDPILSEEWIKEKSEYVVDEASP